MGSNNLKELHDKRIRFEAIVSKFDKKEGFAGPQRIIQLSNIRLIDKNQVLFKSLWLNCGKWSSALQVGNNIAFDAKVNLKKKTKIERITKISILEKDGQYSSTDMQERKMIESALKYGKTIWERSEGVDKVLLELDHLSEVWNTGSWHDEYNKCIEHLACRLVYSEWNARSDDTISRLHEFVVWLKIVIDPSLKDMNDIFRKDFYRNCMEQWFYFAQGT